LHSSTTAEFLVFSYGYRLAAGSNWAMVVEDSLSTVANNFPKRDILLRTITIHVEVNPINMPFPPISNIVPLGLGREPCLLDPAQPVKEDV
jgi:hypothetical protein